MSDFDNEVKTFICPYCNYGERISWKEALAHLKVNHPDKLRVKETQEKEVAKL